MARIADPTVAPTLLESVRYVISRTLVVWLGSKGVSLCFLFTHDGGGIAPHIEITPINLLAGVVFAPVIETVILVALLEFLKDVKLLLRCCVVAVVNGVMHLNAIDHGFGAAWAFWWMAVIFLSLRERSFIYGFSIVAAVHSFANILSMAVAVSLMKFAG